ncbi:MAG: hypothetical protein IBJ18_13370 [Phycisphaerales bacterium]|nr:hypothetical protein [Phycisphaerales bacterium]
MKTEPKHTTTSTDVTATRAMPGGWAAGLVERARAAACLVRRKAGAVSEGRWNTLIIAAFLLVVGSMVCSKVIEDDAEASTKLQPLAGSVKTKWRGGMRAVQTDDVVEIEVVDSASPEWNGGSLRSMEGWVVDEEGCGARGLGGTRQMQAM